ncbi:MAG: T9SS type A sorting domain-containing protein [Bacteroidetes bacterium]|nr:T9SS type A sorting domain-containing protein [Bacteroidota bacterium]
MKKTLPLLIFLLAMLLGKASDTLTVRQVFNFDVGDTFDYKIHHDYWHHTSGGGTTYQDTGTAFFRYIIIGRTFNTDSTSIQYILQNTYPSLGSPNTLNYSHLDSSIIYYTTGASPFTGLLKAGRDSLNQLSDTIFYGQSGVFIHTIYKEALGLLKYETELDAEFFVEKYDSTLIFYSNGNMRIGEPYYDQLTGIKDEIDDRKIALSPNPVNAIVHLSFTHLYPNSTRLILTDVLSNQVYAADINSAESDHNISHLSPGIYLWRIESPTGTIRSGKLIKQ